MTHMLLSSVGGTVVAFTVFGFWVLDSDPITEMGQFGFVSWACRWLGVQEWSTMSL